MQMADMSTLRLRQKEKSDEFYTPDAEVEEMILPSLPYLPCHILLPSDSPDSAFTRFFASHGVPAVNRYLGDEGGWDMAAPKAEAEWRKAEIAIGNPPFSLITHGLYNRIIPDLHMASLFIVPLFALSYRSIARLLINGEAKVVRRVRHSFILPDGKKKWVGCVWLATYWAMSLFPSQLPSLPEDKKASDLEFYPIDGYDFPECPTALLAPADDMPKKFACPLNVLAFELPPSYRLFDIRHTFTQGKEHFYRAFIENVK